MTVLLRHIDHDRRAVQTTRAALHRALHGFLAHAGLQVAMRIRGAAHKIAKSIPPNDDDDFTRDVDWSSLESDAQPLLEEMAKDGAREGLHQVGAEEFPQLYQANRDAIDWSRQRSGELITQVSEATRERVRAIIAQAEADGLSNDEIADLLQDGYWFGADRAETIARTETAFADVQGNVIGWKASGVVAGKEWLTSQEDPCERCAALDHEVVGINEDFGEGDPPLHPRCECTVLPVLDEDAEG